MHENTRKKCYEKTRSGARKNEMYDKSFGLEDHSKLILAATIVSAKGTLGLHLQKYDESIQEETWKYW